MNDFENNLAKYVDLGYEDTMSKAYLSVEDIDKMINDNKQPTLDNSLFDLFKLSSEDVKQKFPVIGNHKLNDGLTLPELLDLQGVHYKITSSYRENAKTSTGKPSNHSIVNNAYDIKPADGYTWDDLKKEIYKNPQIKAWMESRGWGIIDETNPETMKKTGATGKHWHFGPDSLARLQWKENLIKYGQEGFKFEESLALSDPIVSNSLDNMLDYIKKIELSISDDSNSTFTDKIKELENPLFPIIKQKESFSQINSSHSTHTGRIPNLIHSMIPDKLKADILTDIAYLESRFNVNAKNPKSSASGLFQLTNANKARYGYGTTALAQIEAASRMYDDGLKEINKLTALYGNRGKSLKQLMYAYWFRPLSLRNFLITGLDNYSDAQGTSINKVMNKV